MSHRVEQINELLRKELASRINQEIMLPGALITVSQVKCSPDLKYAKIMVSVLPEKLTGTALKKLRKNSNNLNIQLKKHLSLKFIPRFNWQIDDSGIMSDKLEETIRRIHQE